MEVLQQLLAAVHRVDHGKGVAQDVQLSPEQFGDGDSLRPGCDRVPDVDVDVEGDVGADQKQARLTRTPG